MIERLRLIINTFIPPKYHGRVTSSSRLLKIDSNTFSDGI